MTKRAETFRPGEFLKYELEARNLPIGEFAGIIDDNAVITPAIASKLSRLLGTSPVFWLNLESQYRQALGAELPI
jgi:HTH-type transcriptional regulator/antitoxin HigA